MPEFQPNDATVYLVERAQKDDSAALEQLFERFLPRVRRITAIRLGKTPNELFEVDDIAQEAVVDAFRGLQTFDIGSDGKLCSWLSKIVENRIRMELREGRAKKRGSGEVKRFSDAMETFHVSALPGAEATPSQNAAGSELGDRLEKNLHLLSERHREAIIHRFFCEMSYDEIAEAMGLAGANAARSLYSKALKALSSRVLPEPDETP